MARQMTRLRLALGHPLSRCTRGVTNRAHFDFLRGRVGQPLSAPAAAFEAAVLGLAAMSSRQQWCPWPGPPSVTVRSFVSLAARTSIPHAGVKWNASIWAESHVRVEASRTGCPALARRAPLLPLMSARAYFEERRSPALIYSEPGGVR